MCISRQILKASSSLAAKLLQHYVLPQHAVFVSTFDHVPIRLLGGKEHINRRSAVKQIRKRKKQKETLKPKPKPTSETEPLFFQVKSSQSNARRKYLT